MVSFVSRMVSAPSIARAGLLVAGIALAACSDSPTLPLPSAPVPPATTPTPQAPAPSQPTGTTPGQGTATTSNPFAGAKLWVNSRSPAATQAAAWRASRPADAAQMDRLAVQPYTQWFGDWTPDIRTGVDEFVSRVTASGALPVMVTYNIPQRDCGHLNAGGAGSAEAFRRWIQGFADGIGDRKAVVIVEPDGVALTSCLSPQDRETRYDLLRFAIETLKGKPHTAVYVDAGTSRWHPLAEIASRLQRVGIDKADGFSLNVSNFLETRENVEFGERLSARVGGKHFVIDTSRNGGGPAADLEVCNPAGRSLGVRPTAETGSPLADAFLWIKLPGESDGACNGAPRGGAWWAEYALGLAQRTTAW